MPIYLGTTEITALELGTTDIDDVYLGTTQVWPPAGSGFDPLSIPWHTAYWAEDPAWSHPADGAAVSSWNDASGNGRHAVQATGTAQPLYRSSVAALNSKPAVDFDGSDTLAAGTWTGLASGWSVVAIAHCRVVAASDNFVDGDGVSNRSSLGISSSGLKWRFATGVDLLSTISANTTKHLLVGKSGTSGAIEVDGTETTGSTGTQTNTGLKLGSNAVGTSNFVEGEIAFVGLYATDVRAHANWAAFEAWVTSHYGITIT